MTKAELSAQPLTKNELISVRYRWMYTLFVPLFAMIAVERFFGHDRWHIGWFWLLIFDVVLFLGLSIRAWRLKARLDRQQMSPPRG